MNLRDSDEPKTNTEISQTGRIVFMCLPNTAWNYSGLKSSAFGLIVRLMADPLLKQQAKNTLQVAPA